MPSKTSVENLAKDLKNIGPKMASKLVEAGIDSPKKLRQIGAIKAFTKMYASGDSYGDFNTAYLYALEGAIRNCDWLELPDKIKLELKKYAQDLQSKKAAGNT